MTSRIVSRYHPALVALHWFLAILIIADLAAGSLILSHIPNEVPRKIAGLRSHMLGGAAILTLMLLRVAIRSTSATPPAAPTGSALLDRVAWLSHRLIYFVIFAMIGSGLIMALQTNLFEIVFLGRGKVPQTFWVYPFRGVHYGLSRLLMALIALHISGALFHVVIRRDGLLRRMWFGHRFSASSATSNADAIPHAATRWRDTHWPARLILLPPVLLFFRVGWKYLTDPVQTVSASRMSLGSPAAITDVRTEGAIFLALAVLTLASALSARRLHAGLVLVATVVGFAAGARLLGLWTDGHAGETVFKLVPEMLLLLLSALGIFLERTSRHRQNGRRRETPGRLNDASARQPAE